MEEGIEDAVLTASTSGSQNAVLDKLLLQIGTQYDGSLRNLGVGQPKKSEFAVTIVPRKDGKDLEPITKTSNISYEDALAQAKQGVTDYDTERVTASAQKVYEVPWFNLTVKAREGSKGDLERALGREISIIEGRYAKQVVKNESGEPDPIRASFKVFRYDRGVFKRGETPKGSVVATGESATSLTEAEEQAKAEHYKASVFEGELTFKIRGNRAAPEAPAILTARKAGAVAAGAALVGAASGGTAGYEASLEKDSDCF